MSVDSNYGPNMKHSRANTFILFETKIFGTSESCWDTAQACKQLVVHQMQICAFVDVGSSEGWHAIGLEWLRVPVIQEWKRRSKLRWDAARCGPGQCVSASRNDFLRRSPAKGAFSKADQGSHPPGLEMAGSALEDRTVGCDGQGLQRASTAEAERICG